MAPRRLRLLLTSLLALLLPGCAGEAAEAGSQLPVTVSALEADPRGVAMAPEALAALDSAVLAHLEGGAAPGAALAVARRGRLVRLRGYGHLGSQGRARARPETLYDLASLTKVVGTTTAIMLLDEEGAVELDRSVVRYLPWWSGGDARKERVTVRQLLLHRSGLAPFRPWYLELEGQDAYRDAVAAEALEGEPGAGTGYSDLGAMTLGWLVEEVSGRSLDRFLEARVWGPLGMRDTGFRPDAGLRERIAPTELDTVWRDTLVHGTVHDENAWAMGGVAGHAGLFSTARELAVFAQLLLNGGGVGSCTGAPASGTPCATPRPDPVRLLSSRTVERYTRRQDASSSRALGWDTPSGRSSAGDYLSERAFGHTGFTGTSLWVDPELELFVVLLTNRVHPTRENRGHLALRREVHDRVARAVTDRVVEPREGVGGGPGAGSRPGGERDSGGPPGRPR